MKVYKVFRRSAFLQNAALLTVTSLLLRGVGILFRIYLAGRIGPEGMGLYQLVISVYMLVSAFAAAGLCTAVTRLVTDALCRGDRGRALRALRYAVLVSLLVGLVSAGALYLTAGPISRGLLKDARAAAALRILPISLPFMGVSSCLKGYFMARRRVTVTARAQILEQAVRIAVIAALLQKVGSADLSAACAVVMTGDVTAEAASCLRLFGGFRRDRRNLPPATAPMKGEGVMATLMGISLPITATRYLNTALHTVENLLVPDRLTVYTGSRAVALSLFGCLKGMAMPLLFFPSSFLSAIGTLLIPEISESAALGHTRRVQDAVGRTLHLTLTASLLLSGVFWLYAPALGTLLYQSEEVSRMLRVLAPLLPAMYLESMVDGILKGLDQQVSTLRYSLIDSGIRLALIFWLVPRTGMAGFLFVMTVSNLLVAFLNLHRLITVTKLPVQWGRWLIAPLAAVGAAGGGAFAFSRISPVAALPPVLGTISGILVMAGL